MKMKNKMIAAIIIGIVTMAISTVAHAVPNMFYWVGDGIGEVATTIVDGTWILCSEKGGHLRTSMYFSDDTSQRTSSYCSECNGNDVRKPWDGVRLQSRFSLSGSVDVKAHQDAIYTLINATDIDQAQRILWAMDINTGNYIANNDDLYKEATTYRAFYEKMQAQGGYKPTDQTNVSKVKVAVNQNDQTYTVGPFKISYLDDYYKRANGTRINFGEITELSVLNETGSKMQLIDIRDSRGGSISSREYKFPTNGEEFYVVFKGEGKRVSIETKYRYLSECTGTIYTYTGAIYEWDWYRAGDGNHPHWDHWQETGYHDDDGEWHSTGGYDVYRYPAKYYYQIRRRYADKAQNLIGYAFDGQEQWRTTNLRLAPNGIDITMKLSGRVFIDKDSGKVNEGNNKYDQGEAISGVEVTLYDTDGNKVTTDIAITHQHSGSSVTGGGCYTSPIYHKHDGSETTYGKCYTQATHIHQGTPATGGACYQTPVYHQHDSSCYHTSGALICGKNSSTIEYYRQTCGQVVKYKKTCTKQEGITIDGYNVACGKDTNTVEGSRTQNNTIVTNESGTYEFSNLNAQKKYYVKFTYNGMIYTNVLYNENGDDTSKATEEGQNHGNNRQTFNNTFAEIGSYPANYKTRDCITGAEIYNKTYLQEDIADLFKEVSLAVASHNGDEKAAFQAVINNHSGDSEIRYKIQFVADCRISAYTVRNYPLNPVFVIESSPQVVAGVGYQPIYSGTYNQTNVNLGIKARPTFDMALYKDVFHAVVNVNGKAETYTYDARKDKENNGFNFGVNESDYISRLRDKYISGSNIDSTNTALPENIEYTRELRSEEIINGNNSNANIKEDTLFDTDKAYAWKDINHQLKQEDKLQIHVTYKLAIRNQSGVIGAVTELVDYYDNNYAFEGAYVGKADGTKIGEVAASEQSMYGNRRSSLSPNNTMYGTNGKYKTIYLRPAEQKLGDGEDQYVFVTFGLIDPEATLVNAKLMEGQRLYTYNLAEINGYRTYGTSKQDNNSMGIVDKDSTPGNFNPATYERGKTKLEDDESQAPAFIYSKRVSRTLEGTVFEDMVTSPSKNADEVATKQSRFGSGTIDNKDKGIKDVIVELVEIKDGKLVVRQATRTDEKGWYGFGAFLAGDYTIRYTYGSDNQTAMTTETPNIKGSNKTSYNGQDYQSTTFTTSKDKEAETKDYMVDDILKQRYDINNSNKNSEEKNIAVDAQKITKYKDDNYYWYHDANVAGRNDASDDIARKNQVISYSKSEYEREITNHKSEVFNSYQNPQPEHITKDLHKKLVSELERRTYRYAYTAEIPVEVEYTTKAIDGKQKTEGYTYKVTGVDFGVVERPKAKLEVEKKVDHIKVTAADGVTVLFDSDKAAENLAWTVKKDRYTKVPPVQIFMDDELISGAKLEITYKFTVTNNGELDENGNSTTRAKKIIDYVANNLTYTKEDAENSLWEVVKKDDIQNEKNSTLVNNTQNGTYKLVDLSTKQTILQTTEANPLTKALKAGESSSATLVLKKVLSAESSTDDLTYRNITEIVEIDNSVGRYDHSSVPGNQSPDAGPAEDDTYEAENVVVLPPFGSKPTYYVIAIIAAVILAGGIFFIKKKVIDKK